MSKERMGFFGTGLMGRGMAKNLLEKGFPVTVAAHRNRKPVEELVAKGATEVADLASLAKASDIVILCLSTSDAVNSSLFGEGGMLAGAEPGTVFVDTGTSLPDVTAENERKVREVGCMYAAAPLSRTPKQAEEGKLISFVSCEKGLFERLKPPLEAYSEIVIFVSEQVEAAHEIKLMNNIIALSYVGVWAQSYNACIASGLDPAVLHEVVSGGGLNCLNFQNFSKFVLDNDQSGHKFSVANSSKDIGYYLQYAKSKGIDTRIAEQVKTLFDGAVERGYGDDFNPVMTKVVGEMNGTPAGDLPRNKPD